MWIKTKEIKLIHDLEEMSRQFPSFFEWLDTDEAEALKAKLESFVKEMEWNFDAMDALENSVSDLESELSDKNDELELKDERIVELIKEIRELNWETQVLKNGEPNG